MKSVLLLLLLSIAVTTLAQQGHTIVFLNKKDNPVQRTDEELQQIMSGHLANIQRLAGEGKLQIAGPFDGGGGIFVLTTDSLAEAQAWIKSDPGIQANAWSIEVLTLSPRFGKLCRTDGHAEMTSYHFIRYTPVITKFNVQDAPSLFRKHELFMSELDKTGNLLVECSMGIEEGFVLIMKGEMNEAVILSDPAVQAGLLDYSVKSLWTAKGSFCE